MSLTAIPNQGLASRVVIKSARPQSSTAAPHKLERFPWFGKDASQQPASIALGIGMTSAAASLLARKAARSRTTRATVRPARIAVASLKKAQCQACGTSSMTEVVDTETGKRDVTFSMNINNLPSKVGVLLLNIGTPASTDVDDVRDYLARFLGDDRVIDIQPSWLKACVLGLLLNTRPQKSAENYKRIWDSKRGSPLQFHTEDLAEGLQRHLGDDFIVKIGFQYSAPLTGDALESLVNERVSQVIVVPMFPHYASGTVGTTLAAVYERAAQMYCVPPVTAVQPFFENSSFLDAQAGQIRDAVGPRGQDVDHILFSFHGLPVTQCTSAHRDGSTCDASCACRFDEGNRTCYRAQCHETARLLAKKLDLDTDRCSVAFQSRLTLRGTIEWIKPYTDDAFESLAKRGVKRLAVVAPSFTADCIETLEELGITGEEQFLEAGGEELVVVPCVNASAPWITGLAQLVRDQVPRAMNLSF